MAKQSRISLVWEDFNAWVSIFETLLPEVFSESIAERLKLDPPESMGNDDLRWLVHLLPQRMRRKNKLRDSILVALRNHFTHLTAYHGCRPIGIESYEGRGITPLVPASMHAWLTKRVCEAAQNGPTKERLLKACASADATHREGRVYFEASGAHPIDYCGHYLLYGSEYAVAILRSISCFPDYAQLLKQQGRPTLLTCDVPIEWLSERVLEELAASLVSVYYKKKLDPEYVHPRRGEGFGFAIYRDLPSSLIVKISHPEFIRDPIALA